MYYLLKHRLKQNKRLVSFVYDFREFRKFLKPDILSRRIYAIISQLVGRYILNIKPNAYNKTYRNKGVFYVERFLGENEVKALASELEANLDINNVLSNLDRSSLKPSKGFSNSITNLLLNNVVVHGNWNPDLYDYVKYVKSPLKNMPSINKIIESKIRPFVREVLTSNVSIDLFAAYNSLNFGGEETYNVNSSWHRDGDPKDTLKCLIYLCDVDDNNGPFSYIDPKTSEEVSIKAKAGTVLFFKSATVRHRQTKTINSDRMAITFRCHPSLGNKIESTTLRPDIEGRFIPFLGVRSHLTLN